MKDLPKYRTCLLLLLLLPTLVTPVLGQQYSYDGNLWYEIEVSVFTNDYLQGFSTEQARADRLQLSYLPRLRQLLPATTALLIDFDSLVARPFTATVADEYDETVPDAEDANPDVWRLPDFATEAWYALDRSAWKFGKINQELADAPEHRLLWHKVWRQPLAGGNQAPAIFVAGGDEQGTHHELEGSLRVWLDRSQAVLDARLWHTRFRAGPVLGLDSWQLPEAPYSATEADAGPTATAAADNRFRVNSRSPAEIWQMQETRNLLSNEIHYIDNPAFGMLIQLRPYQLPLPETEAELP